MTCPNCGCEYEGNFCPKCGKSLEMIEKETANKKQGKLLGFRSNKLWKKIISIAYLVFSFAYLLAVVCAEKYVNITTYDFIISQICDFLIFVIMILPYIFLSNTKFRNKLPLFKKHTVGASALGLIIITIILGVASGILNEAHSQEFMDDMENHAYTETVTEATCEKDGEIKRFCEYCGISETEVLPALKHQMKEVSRKEATCEKDGEIKRSCEYCGISEVEVLPASKHQMKEVSRKEATETSNGEIIKKCSICGKQETVVLEKLSSSSSSEEPSSGKTDDNSSVPEETNDIMELTNYISKTVQDMSTELKIDFQQIDENDYFYVDVNSNAMFEIYTKKAGGIEAVKLLSSGEQGYTLCGLKNDTSIDQAQKILKSKGFTDIGQNMWADKAKTDVIMYDSEMWVYEKDSARVSEEALQKKTEETFERKYADSIGTLYLGNGQMVEYISEDFSKFTYEFSQLTGYQRTEKINDIDGRYVVVFGSVNNVYADGTVSVYCDNYNENNNFFFAGTANASVKLILDQSNELSALNQDDEVVILARVNSESYSEALLTSGSFSLFDGILYSVNNQTKEIPFINEPIDGLYQYAPPNYFMGHGGGEGY